MNKSELIKAAAAKAEVSAALAGKGRKKAYSSLSFSLG